MTARTHLLDVRNLTVSFTTPRGPVVAVRDLSFHVDQGETLAVVGESGCGKSVTALSLVRLLPERGTTIKAQSVSLQGEDLTKLSEGQMRRIRGKRIGMVFQDPMASLNPVMTIGDQLAEAIQGHEPGKSATVRARCIELLDMVRIPNAAERLGEYPHRLSGGMRQRVMIAMALSGRPELLIADEPTTALDVTIQAQILKLMMGLQQELKMGLLLITHDLGVVAQTAQRVLVMYAGRKVEEQDVAGLIQNPRHPYSQGLVLSKLKPGLGADQRRRLREIPGMVPAPDAVQQSCSFAPRCSQARDDCHKSVPPSTVVAEGSVACFVAAERLINDK